MTKVHFTEGCGRGKRTTDNVFSVTCNLCKARPTYRFALDAANARKAQAFMAQVPREFKEPWQDGLIWCRNCGERKFRDGDRTCYGHYQNYHCAACGHVESRLTETGMSF